MGGAIGTENYTTRSGLTFVVLPLVDILKVVDPRIVVILAGKHEVIDVAGMDVRNGVACFVSMVL